MTGRLAQSLALVGVVVCAGCNNTPVAPTPPKPIVTPTPTPAAARVLSAIRGAVFDTVDRPIVGAAIRVIDGPLAGASAVSDASGQFTIAGAFATDVTVTATGDGYFSKTVKVILADGTGPTAWAYFSLASIAPSVHLAAGAYDVVFVPDPSCADIPDDQRTLSFAGTLSAATDQPSDSYYSVDIPNNIGFGMGSSGNVLSVDIDMDIFKLVSPTIQVSFTAVGQGTTSTLAPASVTLTVAGTYDYCALKTAAPGGRWTNCDLTSADQIVKRVRCDARNHQLVLTRR